MFLALLLVTFAVAFLTAGAVHRLFSGSIRSILGRIIADDISDAWHRYIVFAIYVVGISGGVRMYDLERYTNTLRPDAEPLVLNAERWTLEVYRTIIESLQSIAWMLLVFFGFALMAYVFVRGFEVWQARKEAQDEPT